jgi:hypothetical protein
MKPPAPHFQFSIFNFELKQRSRAVWFSIGNRQLAIGNRK